MYQKDQWEEVEKILHCKDIFTLVSAPLAISQCSRNVNAREWTVQLLVKRSTKSGGKTGIVMMLTTILAASSMEGIVVNKWVFGTSIVMIVLVMMNWALNVGDAH